MNTRCVLRSKIPLVDEHGQPTLTQIGREIPAGASLNVYPFATPGVVNVSVHGVHTIHPLFARQEDVLRACSIVTKDAIGQTMNPAPTPSRSPTIREIVATETGETLVDALKKITPTLLVVGIATGAAFAIGSGLVNRFLFRDR